MAVADVLGLGARLPGGYRARAFEDRDRDAFVAERNREQHWMEQGTAEQWRYWENLMKDPMLLRVSVDAPDGGIAAIGDIGQGFTARPDGSQFIGMTVLAAHRRKGVGTALLQALEDEARRRAVPKLLGGANEGEKFALDWALGHGYRQIGRRIASYIELATFEPERFSEALDRVRSAGIRIMSFAERVEDRDADAALAIRPLLRSGDERPADHGPIAGRLRGRRDRGIHHDRKEQRPRRLDLDDGNGPRAPR